MSCIAIAFGKIWSDVPDSSGTDECKRHLLPPSTDDNVPAEYLASLIRELDLKLSTRRKRTFGRSSGTLDRHEAAKNTDNQATVRHEPSSLTRVASGTGGWIMHSVLLLPTVSRILSCIFCSAEMTPSWPERAGKNLPFTSLPVFQRLSTEPLWICRRAKSLTNEPETHGKDAMTERRHTYFKFSGKRNPAFR